jgi:hypothetical protein
LTISMYIYRYVYVRICSANYWEMIWHLINEYFSFRR